MKVQVCMVCGYTGKPETAGYARAMIGGLLCAAGGIPGL